MIISEDVSPIPLTHIPSFVYPPAANTYFSLGIRPVTLTMPPGDFFSPVPSYSVLLRLTPTPEPLGFPNNDILSMLRHDLYSVTGLKKGNFIVMLVLVRQIMIGF